MLVAIFASVGGARNKIHVDIRFATSGAGFPHEFRNFPVFQLDRIFAGTGRRRGRLDTFHVHAVRRFLFGFRICKRFDRLLHHQTPKRNKPKILGKLLAFTMHESGDRKFLFWGDFKWVVSQDNTLGLVCGDSDVTEAGGETNSCNEFAYFCLPSERTLP